MNEIIAWFDAYRIDHKVQYANGVAVSVAPIGKLSVHKAGSNWFVNGRVVSRKFVKALQRYFA